LYDGGDSIDCNDGNSEDGKHLLDDCNCNLVSLDDDCSDLIDDIDGSSTDGGILILLAV
jgi:hypothetical protein